MLPAMDVTALAAIVDHQAGVLSRTQAFAHGATDNDIARMLRRREWAQVHPGVYVDHTGPLTRGQREWAAICTTRPQP